MNSKLFNIILFFFIICNGCSPKLNYEKANQYKEVIFPFNEKNYKTDGSKFYEIVNTRNSNINIARERALLQAKTLLVQQLNYYITSVANQDLKFISKKEQDIFDLNSKSVSLLLAENMRLVDSKLYKNNDGEYDYWAVYKIDFYDIKDLNKTQTVISSENFNKDLKKIDSNINLDASLDTQQNNYIQFNDTSEITTRNKIELESTSYLGVNYLWGGDSPEEGFDCSGFVRWVYKKSLNILLKRTTLEHEKYYGDFIKRGFKDIKKGDLIYFKTDPLRNISHVGIFLENNKFIHAPNSNEKIKIEDFDGYWAENYVGYASVVNFTNLAQ